MYQSDTRVSRMDTPEAIARQVSIEIKAAMDLARLSQREVAEATQIPLVTLNRRLSGTGKPFDFGEVGAIAGVLGLSVTELVLRAERNAGRAAA